MLTALVLDGVHREAGEIGVMRRGQGAHVRHVLGDVGEVESAVRDEDSSRFREESSRFREEVFNFGACQCFGRVHIHFVLFCFVRVEGGQQGVDQLTAKV